MMKEVNLSKIRRCNLNGGDSWEAAAIHKLKMTFRICESTLNTDAIHIGATGIPAYFVSIANR